MQTHWSDYVHLNTISRSVVIISCLLMYTKTKPYDVFFSYQVKKCTCIIQHSFVCPSPSMTCWWCLVILSGAVFTHFSLPHPVKSSTIFLQMSATIHIIEEYGDASLSCCSQRRFLFVNSSFTENISEWYLINIITSSLILECMISICFPLIHWWTSVETDSFVKVCGMEANGTCCLGRRKVESSLIWELVGCCW